jgi:hypothetical protein
MNRRGFLGTIAAISSWGFVKKVSSPEFVPSVPKGNWLLTDPATIRFQLEVAEARGRRLGRAEARVVPWKPTIIRGGRRIAVDVKSGEIVG